ncbi:MAG: hypothetical protein M3388_08035 [Acidobacteriota bacterium]|nr:hypothetical protein [Acidobacteriota bacterium]
MKNAIAKSAAAFLFSLVVAVTCAAQKTCELSWKTTPLFLNLQIGMSPEQARNVFGKDLKIKIKKKGERTFFQNFIKKPAPNSLRGVRALYLRFFDRRLYQIEIFYESRPNLRTLEDITTALSSQLNFPILDWKIKNNRAAINCSSEISLVADNILNPRVELTNETVRAKVKESREKDKK